MEVCRCSNVSIVFVIYVIRLTHGGKSSQIGYSVGFLRNIYEFCSVKLRSEWVYSFPPNPEIDEILRSNDPSSRSIPPLIKSTAVSISDNSSSSSNIMTFRGPNTLPFVPSVPFIPSKVEDIDEEEQALVTHETTPIL